MNRFLALGIAFATGILSVLATPPAKRVLAPRTPSPEPTVEITPDGRFATPPSVRAIHPTTDILPFRLGSLKSPARISATGSTVYGYLGFSWDKPVGVYEVMLDGTVRNIFSTPCLSNPKGHTVSIT